MSTNSGTTKYYKKEPSSRILSQTGEKQTFRKYALISGAVMALVAILVIAMLYTGGPSIDRAERLLAEGKYNDAMTMLCILADAGDIPAQKKIYTILLSREDPKSSGEIVKYATMAALSGDAESQVLVGKWHHEGRLGVPNPREAAKWLSRAAANEIPEAMSILGSYYLHGKGVVKDPERAINLLTAAADMSDAAALGTLGKLFYDGVHVPRDYRKAEYYLSRSDSASFPDRNRLLGLIYYHGLGTGRNLAKATAFLMSMEEPGDPEASAVIGMMHYSGEGAPRDKAKAEKFLRHAAEAGVVAAYDPLGNLYCEGVEDRPDFVEAVKYLELADANGDTRAGGRLGLLYHHGQGVARDDKKAVQLLARFAMMHRDTEVNAALGNIYYHGSPDVPRDYNKAFTYLKLAADAQDIPSQVLLANLYYAGNGVKRDYDQALHYLTLGLESRHPGALALRGRMYYYGDGGEVDEEKALSLLQEARERGDADAGDFLSVEEYSRDVTADFADRGDLKTISHVIEEPDTKPILGVAPETPQAKVETTLWAGLTPGMGVADSLNELATVFKFTAKDVSPVSNYPDKSVEAYLVYVGDWAVRLLFENDGLSNVEFFAMNKAAPEPEQPKKFRQSGVFLPYALHSAERGIEFDIFEPDGPVARALRENPDMDVREVSKMATYFLADCIKRANRRFDVIEVRLPKDFNFAMHSPDGVPHSALEFHATLGPDLVKKASWQPDKSSPGYISYGTGLVFGQ